MIPGPRQTVSRVRHPYRGEGIAVEGNGPSFFKAEVERLTHGDLHSRMWSPLLGSGWMGYLMGKGEAFRNRFDGDDGRVTELNVSVMSTGTPEYVKKNARKSRYVEPAPEEEQWITFEMRDGSVMAFRRGEKPETIASPPASPAQLALEGIK